MARKRRNKRKKTKAKGRNPKKDLPLFEQSFPEGGPAEAFQEPAGGAPGEGPGDAPAQKDARAEPPAERPHRRREPEATDEAAAASKGGQARWKITPTKWDRVLVMWISGALTVWMAGLTVMWCWSLDPSGTTTLMAVAGALGGLAVGLALSGPVGEWFPRLVRWNRLKSSLALDLKAEGSRWVGQNDLRAVMRLLGVVTVLAVVCGLLSVGLAWVAGPLTDWLTRHLMWTRTSWSVLKMVLILVGMTPIGLGTGMALRVTALIRGGSGQDRYAAICREWLWGGAAGLTTFAVLWWAGLPVLGTMLFMGVALGAAAVLLLQRPEKQARSRYVALAKGRVPRKLHVLCAIEFAGLGMAMAVQGRLLADCVGVSLAGWAVWLAGTLALLARFLAVEDRRSGPSRQIAMAAAGLGAVGTVTLQAMLAAGALAARGGWISDSWTVLVIAGLMQIPLCALVASVIARRRKLLAEEDCSLRSYAMRVAGGLAAGVLMYLLLSGSGAGRAVLLVLAWGAMAAYAATGAVLAGRGPQRNTWLASGVALLLAWVAGAMGSLHSVGPVSAGTWLTALGQGGDWEPNSCGFGVVHKERWRSGSVDASLSQIVFSKGNSGTWWGVWPGGQPGMAAGEDVWLARSAADAGLLAGAEGEIAQDVVEADLLSATRISRAQFDGILLASLPADHPQAWRCYNAATLRRCRDRLRHDRGPMVLRTQLARDQLADAMPVARTFQRVVGSGWVVLAVEADRVDLLLAGPKEAVGRPDVPGACVTDLEGLLARAEWAEAISLVQPRAVWSTPAMDAGELVRSLRAAGVP